MTPRVATVLSARDWESGLVALARDTAEVRLVLRAYRPEEVEEEAHRLDVVVAGAKHPPCRCGRLPVRGHGVGLSPGPHDRVLV